MLFADSERVSERSTSTSPRGMKPTHETRAAQRSAAHCSAASEQALRSLSPQPDCLMSRSLRHGLSGNIMSLANQYITASISLHHVRSTAALCYSQRRRSQCRKPSQMRRVKVIHCPELSSIQQTSVCHSACSPPATRS